MRCTRPGSSLALPYLLSVLIVGCVDDPEEPGSITGPEFHVVEDDGCELGVSPSQVRDIVGELREEVDALEAAGSLGPGRAQTLRNRLRHALRHMKAGRLCLTVNRLQGFQERVDDYVKRDVLSNAEAAPLLRGSSLLLLGPFEAISAADWHTCALIGGGAAYCWGRNSHGQLGTEGDSDPHVPSPVVGAPTFAVIDPGIAHTCAIGTDGETYCWGSDLEGELGDGLAVGRSSVPPVVVAGGHTFTSLGVSGPQSCALDVDGGLFCWGANVDRQTESHVPRLDTELRFASFSQGGGSDICALDADGQAFCWGDNSFGQLGIGEETLSRTSPQLVVGGHTFVAITNGFVTTCALTEEGDAYCWGYNGEGQVGDGTATGRLAPVPVQGGRTFASIGTSGDHTCALTPDGTAYCWGSNRHGQLGDGTTTNRLVPTQVAGDHAFSSITVGILYTCATGRDGWAYCWGINQFGQLGDGTTTERPLPTPVAVPSR